MCMCVSVFVCVSVCVCSTYVRREAWIHLPHRDYERERERERERQCAEVQCCVLEDVQRLRPGHF
jgi:hypothetical protein